ncbi:MAG: hypothetical protein C4K49_10865 [Candidatus Thorarchaeota archaeon]|nr:MAG: hypothetical protein C4K49_10865 [Candidatus Thorarchaeota archaeon]
MVNQVLENQSGGAEMSVFDLYDYMSLYLADWQRQWITETYLECPDRVEKFKELCAKNSDVSITMNAMFVARYLLEKEKIVVFPWVIISRSFDLGAGNWKMLLLDESAVIQSKVSISAIVEKIKWHEEIKLVPHLDQGLYEIIL